ncbi:hypothetical protein C8R44DRAFT_771179 [Mycena epipterygia]|nr:hypothetical protein C8R44DRAFT_771179 [Mycena epipterygia]
MNCSCPGICIWVLLTGGVYTSTVYVAFPQTKLVFESTIRIFNSKHYRGNAEAKDAAETVVELKHRCTYSTVAMVSAVGGPFENWL